MIHAVAGLVAAAVMTACASTTSPLQSPVAEVSPVELSSRSSEKALGLEVIELVLADPDRTIVAPVHVIGSEQQQDRLAGSGCHVASVDAQYIMEFLGACEPLLRRSSSWHGQLPSWRPLLQRRVDPGGVEVTIDGRIESLVGGVVTLLHRAWSQPTERGTVLYVELLPVHHAHEDGRLHLLGMKEASPRQIFPEAGLDVEISPQRGIVISGRALVRRAVGTGLGGGVPGVVQWLLEPPGLPPRRRVLVLIADTH